MNENTLQALLTLLTQSQGSVARSTGMATDASEHSGLPLQRGQYVIVRCRDAGVHAGRLVEYSGREAQLTESRRLWAWKPAGKGAWLSGVAKYGLEHSASKVGAAVDIVLTETCEIIACTGDAAANIANAPEYRP